MLWIFGDIVGLPFLAAQLIQMIREDEADAKVIDAELDARDAAAEIPAAEVGAAQVGVDEVAAAAVSETKPGAGDRRPPAQQPWWETDRRFSDRFRALDDSD